MFKILQAYGVRPNILGAIKATFNSLRANAVSPDGDTEYFDILADVVQGDTRAHFLFIDVYYALRKVFDG